jgi:hypothetical protein
LQYRDGGDSLPRDTTLAIEGAEYAGVMRASALRQQSIEILNVVTLTESLQIVLFQWDCQQPR